MHLLAAYDVTRRDTFTDLDDIWMKELDMYSTVENSVKMVVANKLDLVRPAHPSWLNAKLLQLLGSIKSGSCCHGETDSS